MDEVLLIDRKRLQYSVVCYDQRRHCVFTSSSTDQSTTQHPSELFFEELTLLLEMASHLLHGTIIIRLTQSINYSKKLHQQQPVNGQDKWWHSIGIHLSLNSFKIQSRKCLLQHKSHYSHMWHAQNFCMI